MNWVVLDMGGPVPGAYGDFNAILHSYERSTGVCLSNAMGEFRDFINQRALVDLPLRGVTLRGQGVEWI